MQINYTENFRKNYRKRITHKKSLDTKFQERLQLFFTNPQSSLLRVHKLAGAKKDLYAFSVTGDIRVIYYQEDDKIFLLDIGTHNQVY